MPFTSQNAGGSRNVKFLHGRSHTRLNHLWQRMKQRCLNPKCSDFKYYGARGITVCERWRSSFALFAQDMGDPPAGMTLERKDNNGPYSPDNCAWASRKRQGENTRKVKMIEANGRRMNQSDWARELGVCNSAIIFRIKRGMTPEQAVTVPFRKPT